MIGAEGHRVAGNLGQRLRQQRALNGAGRVQVLLHARKLHVALVIARVFKRHGGLQRQAFEEIGLVEGELASVGRRHHQFGHFAAVAVRQRIDEQTRGGVCAVWALAGCIAVGQAGSGKRRAGHLQLAHHDAQHRLQHFFFADGGMHLARGLEQRLQPRHLLLQIDRFAARRKPRIRCHRDPLWNFTLARRRGSSGRPVQSIAHAPRGKRTMEPKAPRAAMRNGKG